MLALISIERVLVTLKKLIKNNPPKVDGRMIKSLEDDADGNSTWEILNKEGDQQWGFSKFSLRRI